MADNELLEEAAEALQAVVIDAGFRNSRTINAVLEDGVLTMALTPPAGSQALNGNPTELVARQNFAQALGISEEALQPLPVSFGNRIRASDGKEEGVVHIDMRVLDAQALVNIARYANGPHGPNKSAIYDLLSSCRIPNGTAADAPARDVPPPAGKNSPAAAFNVDDTVAMQVVKIPREEGEIGVARVAGPDDYNRVVLKPAPANEEAADIEPLVARKKDDLPTIPDLSSLPSKLDEAGLKTIRPAANHTGEGIAAVNRTLDEFEATLTNRNPEAGNAAAPWFFGKIAAGAKNLAGRFGGLFAARVNDQAEHKSTPEEVADRRCANEALRARRGVGCSAVTEGEMREVMRNVCIDFGVSHPREIKEGMQPVASRGGSSAKKRDRMGGP